MKGIKSWVLDHKLLVGVLLLLIQPLLVHLFLLIPAPFKFLERTWEAGDLITYIAGFEAFAGTIYLGSIAVKQNNQSIDINDRLLKIENDRIQVEQQPQIFFRSSSVSFSTLNDIFNNNGPVYCCDEVCKSPESELYDKFWQKEFYQFTFIMRNLSNFTIRVCLDSLHVEALSKNGVTCLDYLTKPFTFFPSNFSIPPQQELSIGFLLDENSLLEYKYRKGGFRFKLNNSLQDTFIYEQRFLVTPALGEGYATMLGFSDISKCTEI